MGSGWHSAFPQVDGSTEVSVRRRLCPLLSGGPCPRHAPSKPTTLERQLRPEAYERRRGDYLHLRQTAVGAVSWPPVADWVQWSFFWVVTFTRPEGGRERAWSEGGAHALANRDPTTDPGGRVDAGHHGPIVGRTVHPQPTEGGVGVQPLRRLRHLRPAGGEPPQQRGRALG